MPIYHVRVGDVEHVVSISHNGETSVDSAKVAAEIRRISDRSYSVLLNGQSHTVAVGEDGGIFCAQVNGVMHDVTVETERMRLLKSFARGSGTSQTRLEIHAPMPALVTKIEVAVGDAVEKGTGLLILEAMKMENEIKAHHAARVKAIYATKGKAVEKGELLMLLEE